jgi:hypothetical protein
MIALLSRAVLALAASVLGDRRREWALAMEAEFEAAREEGKPLGFALGCLAAACRELPAHDEGRFAIASHAVALLLIIPTAGLLLFSIVADFPFSYLGPAAVPSSADAIGGGAPVLSDANRAAVPSLAVLVFLLAAAHVRIAWLVLERDWMRVAAVGTMIAAATVTLFIFTFVVFDYYSSALAQGAALAVELTGISALARWHVRSIGGSPEAFV